jgi:NADPH:quinone reductase-like Zn-dependent oxidoreductase
MPGNPWRNSGYDSGMTTMAQRIHKTGSPDVIVFEAAELPQPGPGQVLVRVAAAGVGPWDALIRTGHSGMDQPLPLTLGSDIAGAVMETGEKVTALHAGDAVFGMTNPRFIGGYAQYALVEARSIARSPAMLNASEAASVPVIAVTAWKMLFEHARLNKGQRVLIHGAAGNVGAYAVQMAHAAGAYIIAMAGKDDADLLERLGADEACDYAAGPFEKMRPVDVVIDLVGGELQERSFAIVKPGGVLVSSVKPPSQTQAEQHQIRVAYFIVDVTTEALDRVAGMFSSGEISARVGLVLPLAEARRAHVVMEDRSAHVRGKIVLSV